MSEAASDPAPAPRRGLLAGGDWNIDHVKIVDRWPTEEGLARILEQQMANGGGAYNVLKDLARLEAPFPLEGVGLLGDDELGRCIRNDCIAHGIDTTQVHITSDAATSFTDVMSVRGTGRRTFFHQPGANALLAPGHFDFTRSRARVFHFGYLLLLDTLDAPGPDGKPRAAEVFRAAHLAGLSTSLDCVSEHSGRFQSVVAPVLPEVDFLFANEFEAGNLAGTSLRAGISLDKAQVENTAHRLIEMGVGRCAIIHFPEAAFALDRETGGHWQPSLRVPPGAIRGAAGAGDALAAGVLLGLHEGWPIARALLLGVCAAAACLSDPTCSAGVRPAGECLRLAEEFGFVSR